MLAIVVRHQSPARPGAGMFSGISPRALVLRERFDVKPKQIDGVVAHKVLDEMVLVPPRDDKAYSLNGTARAIWELCDGQRDLGQICEVLGGRFDGSQDQLRKDIAAALRQFRSMGILA